MGEVAGRLSVALAGSDVVWGGDWNQPLVGNIAGFSREAQRVLLATTETLSLAVPTAELPGRISRQASIDHVAVPSGWTVTGATHVPVASRLSDHDVYWVDAVPDNVG